MIGTPEPTEPRTDNFHSAAGWHEQAAERGERFPQIVREAEVACALLRSTEDDIDRQVTPAQFMRITATQKILKRISDLAMTNESSEGLSATPAAVADDERNYHFWFNKVSDLDTCLIDIAEEAEVAKVVLLSLDQDARAHVEPALFLRLLGALDAVCRIQALAPAGPNAT